VVCWVTRAFRTPVPVADASSASARHDEPAVAGAATPAPAAPRAPTPFDLVGGESVVRRLVERFYYLMDTRPEAKALRAMHASDLGPMRDKLGDFMIGWLGGPRTYFDRTDTLCISAAHAPFTIDAVARDQWLQCMYQALDDVGVPCEVQALVRTPLARVAEFLKNA
jgi:hemoglobin